MQRGSQRDDGTTKNIQLKFNFIDPIPKVKIDNEVIDVAPPLSWYEYVWIGLPIVLMFIGGALGGMVGALFTNANGRIFRSERSGISKYGLSAALTISAFMSFIILATLFQVFVSSFTK
ncbi:MAG: hypothetical protein H7Z73_01305 [Candidatus Saccharibacteria bacterium]|nr:hypothetical protein [Moraxellaceae bacterium]